MGNSKLDADGLVCVSKGEFLRRSNFVVRISYFDLLAWRKAHSQDWLCHLAGFADGDAVVAGF